MKKIGENRLYFHLLSIYVKSFCTPKKAKSLSNLPIPIKVSISNIFLPKTAIFWRPKKGLFCHETTFHEFDDETNLAKKRTVQPMQNSLATLVAAAEQQQQKQQNQHKLQSVGIPTRITNLNHPHLVQHHPPPLRMVQLSGMHLEIQLNSRCGRVVRDFEREAKNRFNFWIW